MKDQHDHRTLELPLMEDTPASVPALDVPKKRGRPPVHSNAAAKQKAYRERLKARGLREVRRVVRDCRDDSVTLHSDVIDLSEVRGSGVSRRLF
jgi:hypothetical protein